MERRRWVTFDCFGTLVDWHTGFSAILEPLAGANAPALIRAYHEHERILEATRPHRSYKDVLVTAVVRAAAEVGVSLAEREARALPRGWGSMPIFGDVEPMLAALRAMGCRVGILTNCDQDLFEQTHRAFRVPFDLVVTAEHVRDYKPSLSHFRWFDRTSGVGVGDWVHVGCSWYHDITPAKKIGIRSIWLDRDDTGEDPAAATVRVRSAVEVSGAISRLFHGSAAQTARAL